MSDALGDAVNEVTYFPPKQEAEYYTPDELKTKVAMSKKWVETHTQAGRIPGQKQMGRAWRYEKTAIHAALASGQLLLPKSQALKVRKEQ